MSYHISIMSLKKKRQSHHWGVPSCTSNCIFFKSLTCLEIRLKHAKLCDKSDLNILLTSFDPASTSKNWRIDPFWWGRGPIFMGPWRVYVSKGFFRRNPVFIIQQVPDLTV